MQRYSRCHRNAFTLVELLVVIAIIGILVALLLPAIQAAREAARRTECQNHLKQIGLAVQTFHDSQKYFPTGRDKSDQLGVSWAFRILPQLEETAIFSAFVKDSSVDAPVNEKAMRTPINVYACPSRRKAAADRNFDNNDEAPPPEQRGVAALGDYAANAGHTVETGMESLDANDSFSPIPVDTSVAGPIYSGSKINVRRVIDGLSSTLAIGERHIPPERDDIAEERRQSVQGDTAFLAGDNRWSILRASGEGLATDVDDASHNKFGGPHPGVTMFAFLDGHVEAMSNDVEIETLKAMSSIAGGEVISKN